MIAKSKKNKPPARAHRQSAIQARKRSTRVLDLSALYQQAWEARKQAIASFSGFMVGCALRSTEGKIYTGCNIENATFGLTMCAERVALFKALSEGARHFSELCLVASGKKITPPCGSCRQLLWEFCGDIPIYMENEEGKTLRTRLSRLFPSPFEESFLEK